MQVLPRIPEWVLEVLIIDGASTDDTIAVAREHGTNVRIVLTPARGKGAALRVGFEEARGDVIVALDADGSTDPAEIAGFVGCSRPAPTSCSAHASRSAGAPPTWNCTVALGNLALTQLVRLAFGTGFSDLCYGYFAFWRDVLAEHRRTVHGLRGRDDDPYPRRARRAPHRRGRRASSRRGSGGRATSGRSRTAYAVLKAIFAEWHRNRTAPVAPAPHHAAAPDAPRPAAS